MKVLDLSNLPTFRSTYSMYSGGIFGEMLVNISDKKIEFTLIRTLLASSSSTSILNLPKNASWIFLKIDWLILFESSKTNLVFFL